MGNYARGKYRLPLAALVVGGMVAILYSIIFSNDDPAPAMTPVASHQVEAGRLQIPDGVSSPARQASSDIQRGMPSSTESSKAEREAMEGWRLFSDSRRVLACSTWLKNKQMPAAEHGATPVAKADTGATNAEEAGLLQGMDAKRDCANLTASDLAGAMDNLVRASMLGDLDARYELLNIKVQELTEQIKNNTNNLAATTPDQSKLTEAASQLHQELSNLAQSGNHPAAFLLADTLKSGALGVRDEKLSTAWTMVSIQGGTDFDTKRIESYGGYASATDAEKKELLKKAKDLYTKCCKTAAPTS